MSEVLFLSLAALVVLNVPIAISIGFATFIAIAFSGKVPLFLVAQRMFTGMDSFPLLAIPLFMVAGVLMDRGGISKRLIMLATSIVGNVHGGLGIIAILACMFFAAISGSAPATVVAIGTIMVPAMVQAGYGKPFSAALLAAAGTIGVVIPPSIPFVSYGVTMNVSIGKLFAAGILPGILMGVVLMIVCYFYCKKHGYGAGVQGRLPIWQAFKVAGWGIMMPVIILGGIYGGFFTPTEAAAVACVYSLLVGLFIYRELAVRDIIPSFHAAAVPSAMVMLIIACATAMGWVMTTEQVPLKITNTLSALTENKIALLMLINGILLVTGCIMEINASIILLGPIFAPLLLQYGIDPVHFGVIMVINLAIGLLTPPLGINLFVANSLQRDVAFKKLVINVLPMLGALLLLLLAVTYIPALSLLLADILG
ncbi:TRAP dicarboxylate transporter, DctM subunit [uncultured delta proteobacterium]|uniref:TRAP dicarboxylate transporter, DctM subunit n=1 Tax=uncultured delta proteobacterium TaxID=34034 RepID=A0A212IW77_9DELT|nr:TRAP dicarboxylate transporter, DctM subunit [uncultured delta proteobacterium]